MKATLAIFVTLQALVSSYKILAIFPHLGKSHFDSFEPLLRTLAAKGHEITVISNFPQQSPPPNYVDIGINNGIESLSLNSVTIDGEFSSAPYQKYVTPFMLAAYGLQSCHEGLPNANVQELIKSNPKFDLIMIEFFNTRCYLGLAHKLKAPFIGLSSCTLMPWLDSPMGYPNSPSYIPNNMMPFSGDMTFSERVINTICYVYQHILFNVVLDLFDNWAARKYIGDDLPPLEDIAANTSLIIMNTHFTYTTPRPMVPGFIEVAGMHISEPNKLPENIEKWINESPHGVIYFSMGSLIKGHTFPEEKRQMFLRAFGRLPQRVLWKWETETMPGKPENVMLQKWMPQFDILSHPNVKAFISHGGLLGTTEAVHCGVPMVIMPQFGDQFTNAKAVEASGGGVILNFRDLDEESVYNALTTILNPSFNKKAKELSARFRDRPMPPLETAIYWVEYVARHGGAPHLRTAAVGMPLYQYLLLDVVAFLAVMLLIITYVSYRITKAILRRIFKSNSSPKVKKS